MNAFKIDTKNKLAPDFKVPEGYFDSFPDKIFGQTIEKETKIRRISFSKIRWMGYAASIVLLFSVLWLTNNSSESEIEAGDLENYITLESTISQYDLLVGLEPEDIENITITSPIEETTIEEILAREGNFNPILED